MNIEDLSGIVRFLDADDRREFYRQRREIIFDAGENDGLITCDRVNEPQMRLLAAICLRHEGLMVEKPDYSFELTDGGTTLFDGIKALRNG